MSNPVQVDSEISFRSVVVSNQHRAKFSESVPGEGVPSPVTGLQQMMTEVSQSLQDVARELRVLKDNSRPGADRDQPPNNNMNNNMDHDQPQQDDIHGNYRFREINSMKRGDYQNGDGSTRNGGIWDQHNQ